MVSASIQKAFKIIIHYSTSFLKKLTLFYKYNIEYILLIKTSIGICLLYNFLYYQYCIGESEVRKDNDLLLYQNIVANFLISNITIELHKNSNENHLFCSNIQMIGDCSGDLSSERAKCRLQTLSLENYNGEIVERPIKGWIVGEDGRNGVKGMVVDKSSDMLRMAMLNGLLGGFSNFLQNQSTKGVFPISPITGQQNALSGASQLKRQFRIKNNRKG